MMVWNSIGGKSNGMINVSFVAIIKFYKGRSRLIPVWLMPPTETALLIRLYAPLHLFAGANHTKQFTAVTKYDAVFSLCGHPPRLSSSNSFAASAGMYLWTDLLLWLWLTDQLFRYIYLFPSPKFANHRYNKGVLDQWLWAAASVISWLWLILVSGWQVITLAVTQDRHRDPDTGDCEEPTLSDGDNPEEI